MNAAEARRVVLIDDDDVDLMLHERVLKRSGFVEEVRSFHYAEDALNFLRGSGRGEVDVIILDVNMPRMTGFEFLRHCADEFGEDFATVVILLTTSLNQKDREAAEQYAMVKAFFNKPLSKDHLQTLQDMLAMRV